MYAVYVCERVCMEMKCSWTSVIYKKRYIRYKYMCTSTGTHTRTQTIKRDIRKPASQHKQHIPNDRFVIFVVRFLLFLFSTKIKPIDGENVTLFLCVRLFLLFHYKYSFRSFINCELLKWYQSFEWCVVSSSFGLNLNAKRISSLLKTVRTTTPINIFAIDCQRVGYVKWTLYTTYV